MVDKPINVWLTMHVIIFLFRTLVTKKGLRNTCFKGFYQVLNKLLGYKIEGNIDFANGLFEQKVRSASQDYTLLRKNSSRNTGSEDFLNTSFFLKHPEFFCVPQEEEKECIDCSELKLKVNNLNKQKAGLYSAIKRKSTEHSEYPSCKRPVHENNLLDEDFIKINGVQMKSKDNKGIRIFNGTIFKKGTNKGSKPCDFVRIPYKLPFSECTKSSQEERLKLAENVLKKICVNNEDMPLLLNRMKCVTNNFSQQNISAKDAVTIQSIVALSLVSFEN